MRPQFWLRWWLILTVCLAVAAPAIAGDKPKKQAEQEMKWGLQAAKRGYWLEALMRYETANTLDPGNPHILNNIAVALEASGRFDEALVTYETALALAPNDSPLRRNYTQFKEFYDAHVREPVPDEGVKEASRNGDSESDSGESDESKAEDEDDEKGQ